MSTTVTPPHANPANPPEPSDLTAAGQTDPPLNSRGSRFWRRRRSRHPLPARLRARRRRLLLASLPFVVLLAFVATRLVTLNLVHNQTLAAYQAGDRAATQTWGERQGWVNIVEQFRSPFAIGDAHALAGQFEAARPWFEQAFEQVPKGGIDDCKVRVNLGLTYEALGDAAKASERTAEWKQFYDKGIKITQERPKLCDAPEGGQTGQQLQQAEQRMESKNQEEQPQPADPQPADPAKPADPQPTPDPGKTPSEEKQDLLKQQQQRNTTERNQQQDNDDRTLPDGADGSGVAKPW
ncbi:hypothetical protein BA895_21245 [Humibacillus sp. DSM 29435]|uniref:tetratricopeptide repeat protein n=1 Tax=Humibacillus sp. DSM 29435 TaxID=1869167 RepID=UPI000871C146|nr:tetratricopeptide repeat protein [Humibacillus sp. DSM 29435]OFE15752.1 hypothetical protein BA895_21245 [Humibacillus sp. DSM 29435]